MKDNMNNDPKVSIIIAIYNTERYLKICFDLVIAQTYTNWEILAIDDSFTYRSSAICDEDERKDKQITEELKMELWGNLDEGIKEMS